MQVKEVKVERAASAKGKEGKGGRYSLWLIANEVCLTRKEKSF